MSKKIIPDTKADILIIDDTPDNLRLLNHVLSRHYKVRLAPSGNIGVKAALSTPPDLILLDVMMPDSNGYEVAAQLKAAGKTSEIPIIFISALDNTESKVRGFAAGGVDYITKPFQEQEVLARVNIHLSLRALYKQVQSELEERKRAEEALRESQGLFSLFIRYSPIYAYIKSVTPTESRNLYASENFQDMIGLSSSEMIGKTMEELFPPEFAEKITTDDWAVVSSGSVLKLDEELNGRSYTTIKFPIQLRDKTFLAGYTIDNTEQKLAEEHIRQLSRAVEASPTSIVITNIKGDIQYVNPKFTEVTGYSFSEAVGKNPRILKSDLTPPEVHAELWETIPKGKEWHGEFCNRKKNGDLYWESASISPITDEKGAITHYIAVKEDITERKQMEENLKESEEKYRKIFNNEIDAICIFDTETKKILDVNNAYLKLYGYTRDEALQLMVDDISAEREKTDAAIQQAKATGDVVIPERNHRKKDGTVIQVEISAGAYTWKGRNVMFSIIRDITERKRAESALRESEEKYRTVANFTYDWEAWRAPDGTYLYVSPSCERITGYTAAEFTANPNLTLQITHLDDRQKIIEHLEAIAHHAQEENIHLDFRIITSRGETRWIEHSCVAVHGQSGQWLGRRESNRDITERKQAEEREHEQRALAESLRNTAEALNSSLQLDDILDRILDNVERVVPYDAMTVAWLEGEQISILRHRGYNSEQYRTAGKQSFTMNQIPTFAQTIETRQPLVIPDVKTSAIWTASPQTEWVRSHIKAPIVIDNKVIGIINLHSKTPGFYNATHARNLQTFANQVAIAARNAQLYQEIQHIAMYDSLTELYNRRYMEEALTREYARATRRKEPLSVVMIDMDGLKKFNDTYGHDMGDQAIKIFADQIRLMTRAEDIACRYGGDEFLIILYNTDTENATKRVREWQKQVDEVSIPFQDTNLHISFSAGIATYPTHGDSINEVVKAADEALYQNKKDK